MAFLEPRRRRAKNEIDMAANKTVLKILPAAIEQDRVLPAEKTAVAKRGLVAIDTNGQRLADGPSGILKRNVFGCEIIRIDRRGWRLERADGFAFGIGDAGVKIEGENRVRGIGILTDKAEEGFLTLHVNEFFVDARRDVNDHRIIPTAGWHRHDRRLHRLEFLATILRDIKMGLGSRRKSERNQNSDGDWFKLK